MAFVVSASPKASPRSQSGLLPFLRPYRGRIALAVLFLVLAAVATLVFPVALRSLIDGGLSSGDKGNQLLALREHFLELFGVAVALGLFSAARFYMVSWLGERVTADLRNAVYAHVLEQSPEFFETTQTGEVLSRLTTDTTLVQTVVGSSLSLGLRNAVMGVGALAMLVWTNPYVMTQVLGILVGATGVLGEVYGDLLRAAGATERLMELLDSRSPVTSPANPVPARASKGGSAITLEAVTFNYPSRPATPALKDFSLAVKPGETVALVG